MNGYIAENVTGDQLRTLASQYSVPWIQFYGERVEETVLTWWEDVETPVTQWQHGRLFYVYHQFDSELPTKSTERTQSTEKQIELAWWRHAPDNFSCRLFTQNTPPDIPAIEWERISNLITPKERPATVLHGELDVSSPDDAPTWSEARIPRLLRYPVDGRPVKVALNVRPVARNGRIIAHQLLGVVGGDRDER